MRQKLHKPSVKQAKNRKKPYLVAALLVVLIGAGVFGFVKYRDHKNNTIRPENSVDYSAAKKSDNKSNENRKSSNGSSSSDSSSSSTTAGKDTNNTATTQPTLDSPATTPSFSVTVTGANADDANHVLRVSTLVNGVTSGTCKLTVSKSGQTSVTAENQVAQTTNTYTCPNFTIPYSQFPSGGSWNVSVSVTNNNKTVTGNWAGGSVTINK